MPIPGGVPYQGAPIYMGFAHWTWDTAGKPVPWNAAGGWNPNGSLTAYYAKIDKWIASPGLQPPN